MSTRLLALLLNPAFAVAPAGWGQLAYPVGCAEGLEVTQDLIGRCCRPNEAWSGKTCVAAADAPPVTVAVTGCVTEPPLSPAEARPTAADPWPRSPMRLDVYLLASRDPPEVREKAHETRSRTIYEFKPFLTDLDGPEDQKAELILRLANLYEDEGRAVYLDEVTRCAAVGQTYHANLDERYAGGGGEWERKAKKIYAQLLSNYSLSDAIPEVRYKLGLTEADLGHPEEAIGWFTEVLARFPTPPYATLAALRLGDAALHDKHDPAAALVAYQRAAADPTSELHTFALYKIAWCQHELGDERAAIDTMKQVVIATVASPAQ